ncbi:DUF6090 family protein [Chryseolinea sp. H1M3-3]|uniref:DUF6090 family protein n=1 Tax=Chryseolinea sp. H1M3-3 TaxID=3034144 RepID=UPI0023EC7AA2|nr:DUF6090 family protein [Chryseolinea sp. H1M3-3]
MMARFFKMLNYSNNFPRLRKYLLYAIGEILLVMIGILLAMQVNNWNEKAKQQRLERKILNEVKVNLNLDLDDIQSNILFNSEIINANSIVLSHIDNQIPFHDSLQFYLANLLGNTRLLTNTSAYENLKSVGLDIISNDTLRTMITNLHSTKYGGLIGFERGVVEKFYIDQLLPYTRKQIRIVVMWERAYPFDTKNLMSDREFAELLRIYIVMRRLLLQNYEDTKQYLLELTKRIDKELHKE